MEFVSNLKTYRVLVTLCLSATQLALPQGSWYVRIPLKSWRAELCVMLVALWVIYMVKQPLEPKKNTREPSAVGLS